MTGFPLIPSSSDDHHRRFPTDMSDTNSPFIALGPDICHLILTFLAGESLDAISTDGYRRLLPFAVCCTQHYNFTTSAIRGLAMLPLRFKLRQSTKLAAIPPFPTALYSIPRRRSVAYRARHAIFGLLENISPSVPDHVIVRAVAILPSLRSLHLYRTTRISDAGLSAILDQCTNLRELRVPANHSITTAGLQSLVRCKYLQSIDFGYCRNFGDKAAYVFRQMPNLQELNVAYWNITDEFVRIVCQSPNLRQLDVSACPRLTERACIYVAEYATRLEVFNFRCCGQFNDHSSLGLADCVTLRVVDLSLAKGLTDNSVSGFGDPERMPSLESLRLSNCSLLTDSGVASISKNTNIRCLDLSFCEFLTDKCVTHVCEMRRLEDLDLSGCGRLSDRAIDSLSGLSNLQSLGLAYCSRLTDDSVEYLSSSPSCPFRTIDVRSCREFSRHGITQLGSICETLLATIEDKALLSC